MPVQTAQDFVNGLRTGVQDTRAGPVASAFEATWENDAYVTNFRLEPYSCKFYRGLVQEVGGSVEWRQARFPAAVVRSAFWFWFEELAGAAWYVGTGDNHSESSVWHQAILGFGRRGTTHCRCGTGYAAILTTLMAGYKQYLEAIGPQSVDNFAYSGDRLSEQQMIALKTHVPLSYEEVVNALNFVKSGCSSWCGPSTKHFSTSWRRCRWN